ILKNLGVKTASLGSWGHGIELTMHFRRKAHALARQFGITRRDITNWMAVKGRDAPRQVVFQNRNLRRTGWTNSVSARVAAKLTYLPRTTSIPESNSSFAPGAFRPAPLRDPCPL